MSTSGYDRQPIGALQGLAPDRVLYAGTTSKSLTPGLRIGWLVVPHWLRSDVLETIDPHSTVSVRNQLALADFITTHRYERHLRRMRTKYDRRRRQLLRALDDAIPGATIHGIAAGIHALIVPHDLATEDHIVASAQDQGIRLQGLAPYWQTDRHLPGVLIGYGRPADHQYGAALASLGKLLASFG